MKVRKMARLLKARKRASRRSRAGCNDRLEHESPFLLMEVDEMFWMEEGMIGINEKKVRETGYSFSVSG